MIKHSSQFGQFWQQLRTLNKDNIADAPKAVQAAFGLLLVLLIFLMSWLIVLSPLLDRLHAKRQQEQQLLQTYQHAYQQSLHLPTYQAWQADQQQSLSMQLRALPKSAAMTAIIGQIKQQADQQGVQIISASMLPMVEQAWYIKRPINVMAQGDYHALGRWLTSLAKSEQLITMHDFELSQNGQSNQLRITLHTYQTAKKPVEMSDASSASETLPTKTATTDGINP